MIGALAVEVDGHDGGDPFPPGLGLVDRLVDENRVDVPRAGFAVDEDRYGTAVGDRVGGRREREGRDDDPVAGLHAGDQQGEVKAGAPAGDGDRMFDALELGERGLELVELGPDGRDPVRVERLEQQFALGRGHVRRREVDAVHDAQSADRPRA